jgi:hypothetical protein
MIWNLCFFWKTDMQKKWNVTAATRQSYGVTVVAETQEEAEVLALEKLGTGDWEYDLDLDDVEATDVDEADDEALAVKKISKTEFLSMLKPNHIRDDSDAWDGCMFETYGEELEFVMKQPAHHIWTLKQGDGDDEIVVSGMRIVNRIGYFVSTQPWTEDTQVEFD